MPPRPDPLQPPITVNGWSIYAHPLFIDQVETLLSEVEQLRATDPEGYRQKKKTKLLTAIYKMAFEVIPQNPGDRSFWQGNTLGAPYRHWHRGKFFEGRYRLFFRYSAAGKAIVLAWVNDEETLRTFGSKADAYAVFRGMLERKRPPDDWDTLPKEARAAGARAGKIVQRAPARKK